MMTTKSELASPTIEFYDGINHTPAIPLLARAWHELLREELMMPVVMIGYDDCAFVASLEGEAVGVLSFRKPWGRELAITIGYVAPNCRGRGIYRCLWERLVAHAKEKNVVEISATTHVRNLRLRSTAKALGRTEHGVVLRYKVT